MTPRDLADVLLRKAHEDLHAMRSLGADPEAADRIVGFQGQQAVEKALKAVLTTLGLRHGRTHDLDALLEQLAQTDIEVPDRISAASALTPFGVALRYVDVDLAQPLDRQATIALVGDVVDWAADRVQEIDPMERGGPAPSGAGPP